MSSKLTNSVRDKICKEIIDHRFKAEDDAQKEAWLDFGDTLYHDVFSAKEIKLMLSLPDGWLQTTGHIKVQFGSNMTQVDRRANFRIPNSYFYACLKRYDDTDPLYIQWDNLRDRSRIIKEAMRSAKREVDAVLYSLTTFTQVRKTWPEVWIFAEKHASADDRVFLPAVQLVTLNSLLNLPPVAEAA